MLFKKIFYVLALLLFPAFCAQASEQPSNKEVMAAVGKLTDTVNRLTVNVRDVGADVHRLKIDSTPEAIHNFASAVRDGVKVEHALKMPNIYSAVFGFTTCLSTYALWRGTSNYWNAHRNAHKSADPKAYEEKNRTAAKYQIGAGLAGLTASIIGLFWSSSK